VEPARGLCARARTILGGHGEVYCATLQKAALPESSFDVVTLWDVLEHVTDPVQFVRLCTALLKPGGYLFANVPDLDSFQARVMGRRWPLLLPEHFNYFTRESLELCGKKAGLNLRAFGRRPAFFSLDYFLYRLWQHEIPGSTIARTLAKKLRADLLLIPVHLGETYGVWVR
jgi:SAM-dependent methyltransferase